MGPTRLLGRDDELDYLRLYNVNHPFLHVYLGPWLLVYGAIGYIWVVVMGIEEFTDTGLILVSVAAVLQGLTFLSCQWSVHVKCLLTCSSQSDPFKAEFVKVVPLPNNGSPGLVQLHRQVTSEDKTVNLWFMFQKMKYVYDSDEKKQFEAIKFPDCLPFSDYENAKGFVDEKELLKASDYYGKNAVEMDVPKFLELFIERAIAPFFVFQVFCVGLWTLDDYCYYSLVTLAMLIGFEATLVGQTQRNLSHIREMGSKPYSINVYRNRRWRQIVTTQLCPGDLVSVTRSSSLIPCDLLLIRGSCIVDESLLTGESIPVMKEPIEGMADNGRQLDLSEDKLHVLSGGTRLVLHTPPPRDGPGMTATDNGCLAFVLRTGFNTSQGRLLRTILFSVKRVTANNKETFTFILFLLAFAIAAASYVWTKGTEDPDRSRYKLFIECSLIVTTVIPPELPIELSLAVNTSVIALTRLFVYCTEPFRIPFAGKVEVCCFDKTGTLTADKIIVEGVASCGSAQELLPVNTAPLPTVQTLATCHSLVPLDDEIIGDPLEKETLAAVDWNLTRGSAVIPNKMKTHGLKIFQRFHFASALKRMSVIAGHTPPGSTDTEYMACVKGAPEVLQSRFSSIPEDYETTYLTYARQGARVLALGHKVIGTLSHQQVRELSREEVESDLNFVGFLIVSCPLKPTSKSVIKEIIHSSHHVVMITGDNPLTACHVAKELKFTRKETLIYFPPNEVCPESHHWESIDGETVLTSTPPTSQFDLCVVGPSLDYMAKEEPSVFRSLLPYIKVYARVSPKQKEQVVNAYKSIGLTTLMCGDGTNDVGALKHAEVGVALLTSSSMAKPDTNAIANGQAPTQTGPMQNGRPRGGKGRGGRREAPRQQPQQQQLVQRQQLQGDAQAVNPAQVAMQQMIEEMEAEEKAVVVNLGDASIAAPFTSKLSSIQCICHIIKQGRCTLVTTLQMFKILGINALVFAYCQSVLYLDGVKASDAQATLQGLLLAGCFLNISRTKPLKTLSKQRPLPNIFNLYTILSVVLQFCIHLGCLLSIVKIAKDGTPDGAPGSWDAKIDKEKDFEPSLLNTSVYIMNMALQVSTFAVNYRGHPFMESMTQNKPFFYSLSMTTVSLVAIVMGLVPGVSQWFELVEFTSEYRMTVLKILMVDFFGTFLSDRLLFFFFASSKLRHS